MSRKDLVPHIKLSDVQHLPRVHLGSSVDNVQIEYTTDYWDGPLSGMCTWHGKRYYFHCIQMDNDNFDRTFVLLALSEQQLVTEEYWHREFVDHVLGQPRANWAKFYGPYEHAEFTPCTTDQAVAWMTY